MFQLQKAQKQKAKLKLGVSGCAGSGKTYSALLLAKGLCGDWGKIAVIDTENMSADLYSHLGDYQVLHLESPFTPERYINAIQTCENAGVEVIIIDSTTHEWDGTGGCLEISNSMPGNSYVNWGKITPRHNAFIQAILQSDVHVICTTRRKQDYAMEPNNKGKMAPVKLGLKEVQRDGFEYELTLAFEVDISHFAKASKDRTGLFMDKPEFVINEDTGKALKAWANDGIEPPKMDLTQEMLQQSMPMIQKKVNEGGDPKDIVKNLKKKWNICIEMEVQIGSIEPQDHAEEFGLPHKDWSEKSDEQMKAEAKAREIKEEKSVPVQQVQPAPVPVQQVQPTPPAPVQQQYRPPVVKQPANLFKKDEQVGKVSAEYVPEAPIGFTQEYYDETSGKIKRARTPKGLQKIREEIEMKRIELKAPMKDIVLLKLQDEFVTKAYALSDKSTATAQQAPPAPVALEVPAQQQAPVNTQGSAIEDLPPAPPVQQEQTREPTPTETAIAQNPNLDGLLKSIDSTNTEQELIAFAEAFKNDNTKQYFNEQELEIIKKSFEAKKGLIGVIEKK